MRFHIVLLLRASVAGAWTSLECDAADGNDIDAAGDLHDGRSSCVPVIAPSRSGASSAARTHMS
jgi:hypothetical protein